MKPVPRRRCAWRRRRLSEVEAALAVEKTAVLVMTDRWKHAEADTIAAEAALLLRNSDLMAAIARQKTAYSDGLKRALEIAEGNVSLTAALNAEIARAREQS